MTMTYRTYSSTPGQALCLGLLGLGLVGCSSTDNGASPDGGGSSLDAAPGQDSGNLRDSTVGHDSSPPGDAAGTDASDAGHATGDAEAGTVAGNVVIADQFNNRVIEVDQSMNVVWSFGDGKARVSPTSVVAPNDAERLPNGQTLISGTGDPGATGAACAALDAGGCSDNRVLLVNHDGGIAWTYSGLSGPVCARMLATGRVLITDQGSNRIIEVLPDGGADAAPVWQYAPTDDAGASLLNGPNSAERTPSGSTVIADEGNGRVVEVGPDGGVIWTYSVASDAGAPPQVAYASRLPNGDTLITNSTDNVIIEVASDGGVVWKYNITGDAGPAGPTRAVRLANGHTLISDQTDSRVFEIDNGTPPKVVATFLVLAGDGGTLSGSYDAKRIGDYTGLSTPAP